MATYVTLSLFRTTLKFNNATKSEADCSEYRQAATRLLLRPDDHCPVSSVAILRVRNANPLRAVQQQIGAMSS